MQTQLPDFTRASIIVIGDIMLDRYWFGDTARISPEAPVPVVRVKQCNERPGGAGNVALNIAALGAHVTLLGLTGKDDAARLLKEQLSAANVNHRIQELNNIPTITKLRIISRHQQLLRLDFEETFPTFDPAILIDSYTRLLTTTHLVVLSDYNKGTLCCAPLLIKLAKDAKVPVLVDPKGSNFSIYQGASIITPNLKEFETIVGPCQSEQDIVHKGQQLLERYDIETLLLTRGEQGMTLIQRHQEEVHWQAYAREVFDVTGAGDTVIGVLGAAIASGAKYTEAVSLANLAASLAVAKLGAATISVPELEAAIHGSETSSTGIMSEEQLLIAITAARLQGKKIVFTNGCFDILHAGHVKYLQQAKQLGDYLIVAINDDASIMRLKGPGRPINHVEQRMAVLAGLGVVDWVIAFSDDTPNRLLKKCQPDILVKGGDYTVDQVIGADIVYAYGGDVRVLGIIKNVSTTSMIDHIIKTQKVDDTL